MPRIPEASAPAPVGIPTSQFGDVVKGQIEKIGQGMADVAAGFQRDAEEREVKAQKAEFVTLSGQMEAGLTQLQLDIERDPKMGTADAATVAFQQGAQEIVKGTIEQARFESVGVALEARGLKSGASGSLSVNRRAWKRELDTAAVQLEANEDIYVTSFARADDPQGREDARDSYQVGLEMALDLGHITKVQAQRRLENFDTRGNRNLIARLSTEGRFDEARAILSDPENLPGMDSTEQAFLSRTVDTAETHAKTLRDDALKAAEEARSGNLLRRIFTQPGALPTISEVLDADLGRVVTKDYIDLIERKARGEDIDYLDSNVVNDLYVKVRSGKITQFSQLKPWVGHGLPIAEAEKLMGIATAREKNPAQKALDDRTEKFLAGYKGPIAGTTSMGMTDPLGGPNFFAFRVEVERRIAEAIEKGEDPYALLTPGTKEFLGPLYTNFKRGQTEIMDTQFEEFEAQEAEYEASKNPPAGPPKKPFGEFVQEQMK